MIDSREVRMPEEYGPRTRRLNPPVCFKKDSLSRTITIAYLSDNSTVRAVGAIMFGK